MYYKFKIRNMIYYGNICSTRSSMHNKNNTLYFGIFYRYVYKHSQFKRLSSLSLWTSQSWEITKITKEEFDRHCVQETFEINDYASYMNKPLQVKCYEKYIIIDGKLIPEYKLKRVTKEEYENYIISQL